MADETTLAFQRLFIAVPVPNEICEEIARIQDRLKRLAAPGCIRWTRPGQFHVTLKFIGDFPSAQLEALKQSVAKACHGQRTVKLSAQTVGCFPSAAKPRVFWVGVHDASAMLDELQHRIHEAIKPFAPADASERFNGHITLGRVRPRHRGSLVKLMEQVAKLRSHFFGEWTVNSVEVLRSELTSVGVTHQIVAAFPLL